MQHHPIPAVTDPLQYRAIGIVRGTYVPQDKDKFTLGALFDSDGHEIDAAVLGRVITLMRRHIEIESPHLWVVYPRSRAADKLHLQISGIWEPSTLNKDSIPTFLNKKNKVQNKKGIDEIEEGDNYFSIRGELIYTKPETSEVILKIRQKPKIQGQKMRSFKIFLYGQIPINYLRHFVSINARRNLDRLHINDYEVISSLPVKKEKKVRTDK